MKKLMTTMLAVAVGVGLRAVGIAADTGTSFEGLTGDAPYDIYASTGELTAQEANQTYWVTNGTETLTVVAGVSDEENRPAPYEDATQTKYLSIKTTLGNPVTRNVSVGGTGTSIGSGFYFDSLVKFTAFDDDPAIDLNGGKLAIWLKENLDANDEPTSTNLMVTAGFLDGQGGAIVTNYTCMVSGPNLNDGGWHRVTVKAIADITNGSQVPGFVVYVDTVRVTSGAEKGIDASELSPYAYLLNSEGSLFPSAAQSGLDKDAIAAVQFDGQGDVDDLLFTTVAPDFAEDTKFFSIYLGEHVTSVQGYDPDGNVFTIGGSTNFVYGENKTVQITGAGCDSGWMQGTVTNESGAVVSGSYTITAGGSLTVNAKPLGAYVDGTPYETLAEAVAAANAAGSSCKVTLADNATSGVSIGNANSGVSIILDLAGNDITVASGAAITLTNGTLIVTNSTPADVGIVSSAAAEGLSVSAVPGTTLTFAGGQYNSPVDAGGAVAVVYAEPLVKFVGEWVPDASVTWSVQEGYALTAIPETDPVEYTLTEAVNYVAQVGETQYETLAEAFAAATNGATLKVLSDLTEEAPLPALVAGGSMTLDLNGKTIVTAQANNYWMVVGGTLVVTDSTEQATGKIQATPSGSTIFKVEGTFTLAAGTLDMTTVNPDNTASGFNVKATGTGYMNGGTVLGRIASGENGATLVMNGGAVDIVQSKNGGAVTINGGDVGTIEKTGSGSGTIVIPSDSAARFGEDETQYCAAGYCTTLSGGWYVVGLATYTITYKDNEGNLFTAEDWAEGYTAPTTFTVTAPATLPVAANIARDGVTFNGWTNSVGTTIAATTAGIFTNLEVFADFTVLGPTYPSYINTSDAKITGEYDAWATANNVPAGANNYEAAFLLNVAPGLVGATLNATAVSISGTTVTIDINHNVNGYPYVKKAATVAGLASATPIAIESITPADLLQDLDNGARITLTGESGAAQFYQIGVQSAPVAVPNAD